MRGGVHDGAKERGLFVFEIRSLLALFLIHASTELITCPRTTHLFCYWVYPVHDGPLTQLGSGSKVPESILGFPWTTLVLPPNLNCPFIATTMSEPKRASPPPKGHLYRRARAVLIGLASLYALAVLLVMTPLIQTQFRDIPFLLPHRRRL